MMAPDGKPDDGLLDYCIVSYGNRLKILALLIDFMNGKQGSRKPVTTGRTRSITVTALQGVLPAHADGETLCEEGKYLKAEIIPGGLEIITGAPEQ